MSLLSRLRVGACAAAFGLLSAGIAHADLNLGDNLQNPDLATQPPFYTDGLPPWVGGTLAASLDSLISPPTLGTPFVGIVHSEVWYVNGVDASGGLGFAYRFTLDPSYSADGLESASFAPASWAAFTIFETGSDNSGTSTGVPAPSIPPAGFTSWTDGDPYTIKRDPFTGAPEIRWTGALGGTTMEGGQTSALIWFETDATLWTDSIVTLLDGGVGGSARILVPFIPEPTGVVLGMIGLAAVGLGRRKLA